MTALMAWLLVGHHSTGHTLPAMTCAGWFGILPSAANYKPGQWVIYKNDIYVCAMVPL